MGISIRPVKLLEKKLVTTRAMTTFSEQDARAARKRRKTESGNTSLLLTSLVVSKVDWHIMFCKNNY